MKSRFALGVVSALLCAGLTGCADDSSAGSDGTVKIAVVLPGLDYEYWKLIKEGAEEEAAKLGDNVEIVFSASQTGNTERYIADVQDAYTKGADVLVAVVDDGNAVSQTLKGIVDDGVPVITVNANVDDSVGAETFIGTDELAGGANAGRAMKEALAEGGDVGILHCMPGNVTNDSRVQGFTDALEGSSIEVVSVLDAKCDPTITPGIVADMLTTNPQIVGIFAVSDYMAMPATRAIADQGLADQVTVIGYDAGDEVLPFIEDGRIYGSVAQFPKKMGMEAVKAAVAAANGETVESRIDTGTEFVSKANIEDYKAQ